jgi:heme ABC exporter ATP-binding subunit CcmA
MTDSAIRVENVTKFFGDFPAVRSVSFDLPRGAVLALLGRNGAGKTTMLNMLAGISSPSKGSIEIGGTVNEVDRRRKVGFLGHGQWLYDDLTATENLEFFAKLYDVAGAAQKIEGWLEDAGLARFHRATVGEFSRGMRQRVAVARAFLHDPEILLLDEPWTALDDRAIEFLSGKIREAQQRGCTIVVCSHQLREALEVATDVAVLDRGRLALFSPNDAELRAAPETLYQRIS